MVIFHSYVSLPEGIDYDIIDDWPFDDLYIVNYCDNVKWLASALEKNIGPHYSKSGDAYRNPFQCQKKLHPVFEVCVEPNIPNTSITRTSTNIS